MQRGGLSFPADVVPRGREPFSYGMKRVSHCASCGPGAGNGGRYTEPNPAIDAFSHRRMIHERHPRNGRDDHALRRCRCVDTGAGERAPAALARQRTRRADAGRDVVLGGGRQTAEEAMAGGRRMAGARRARAATRTAAARSVTANERSWVSSPRRPRSTASRRRRWSGSRGASRRSIPVRSIAAVPTMGCSSS